MYFILIDIILDVMLFKDRSVYIYLFFFIIHPNDIAAASISWYIYLALDSTLMALSSERKQQAEIEASHDIIGISSFSSAIKQENFW